jgi:hypothetical protein
MTGVIGGVLLSLLSVLAQMCYFDGVDLSDWGIFSDDSVLGHLFPLVSVSARVENVAAVVMLVTLVPGIVFIVVSITSARYYRGTHLVKSGAPVLLFVGGAGVLVSWALVILQWDDSRQLNNGFLETLGFAGQETKLLCALLGLVAVIGGIVYLASLKRFTRAVPAFSA